jgi:hypothetical protein
VIALDHVASTGIIGAGGENHVAILIDSHESALPEEGLRELNVDFANLDRLREGLTGRGVRDSRVTQRRDCRLFLYRWAQSSDNTAAGS